MASKAGYVTAQDMVNFLAWMSGGSLLTISTNTVPTIAIVEDFISAAEVYVEKQTNRNWRSTFLTVTDEHHSWSYTLQRSIRKGIYSNIITIDLYYNNIHDFISGTDKIEIWDGSNWIDLVSTGTKGEAMFDGDFFCDLKTGRLYLHSNFPAQGMDNIRITYRYGEYISDSKVDILPDLKQAVKYIAGADLQQTYGSLFQYQIEDSRGAGNYGLIAKDWRARAQEYIEENKLEKAFNLFS